jgi:putative heme-binding domain-containing protein
MEDADGSMLVIDTGAWFIHGCPLSRVAKPEIKGSVFRVRRIGAARVRDPRGESLELAQKAPADLTRYLEDPRPFVRDRVQELLVEVGDSAIDALLHAREHAVSSEARCAAVWALYRIGTPRAKEGVRHALNDANFQVRVAAATAVGMARDHEAAARLMAIVRQDQPAARRQAATALGQIGDTSAVPALLSASARVADRFLDHALTYALIELKTPGPMLDALRSPEPGVRKAALIALDQIDGSPLTSAELTPMLSHSDKALRTAALWIATHHSDWSGAVLSFLRDQLRSPGFPGPGAESVREALSSFCADSGVQNMVADLLGDPAGGSRRQLFLLDTMDRCGVREWPQVWTERLGGLLDRSAPEVRVRVLNLIRAVEITSLDDRIERIANSDRSPPGLRTTALAVLVRRRAALDETAMKFLLGQVSRSPDAAARLSAAQVLGKARLTDAQLSLLAHETLPQADALTLPSLLEAFRNSDRSETGKTMVTALLRSHVTIGEPDARRLGEIVDRYPADVRTAAHPLLARLQELQKARIERLRKLEALLTAGGDAGRGRRIFFGEKVACYHCHTIGNQGGHVGPDLTAVGAIRSGHDILEAIVFPSASFVPGFEIYNVETRTEVYSGVRGQDVPGAVTLVTGPNAEIRIPRKDIISIKPSNVSLMPEGLDESLTRAEFVDLLAFLQSQTSRVVSQNMRAPAQAQNP